MTDDQYQPEDDDRAQDPMQQYGDLFREKADALESAARKVGLYIRDVGLTMGPVHTDEGIQVQPVMVGNFTVGDQAWSARVQNPEQDTTETEFRKMAVEMEKDKFEETRAELERRMREGRDLLGDAEEE